MYTMKQVCEALGIGYEKLRFYCDEGLVPNVKRDDNNYRQFDDRDLNWLRGVLCLKRCGMGLRDIKVYMRLCMQGITTINERKKILVALKQKLTGQMEQLQANIDYVDEKHHYYNEVLAGNVPYTSNLVDTERDFENHLDKQFAKA